MDKLMIHAVAGAGKTTLLVNQLNLDKRTALITYTRNNQVNLEKAIIKKFGYFPKNIQIFGLFEFLYSFCYRPLQYKYPNKGICFDNPSYYLKGYHHKDGRIYSNQLSRFLLNNNITYLKRINRFFDQLFVDEAQDITSDDFDWLMSLNDLKIPVTFVGDYYQSTFSSSRRGNKGQGITANLQNYKEEFQNNNFYFDETTLNASYRCSKNVSNFIQEKVRISMDSHCNKNTKIELISDPKNIEEILNNDEIKKLFYNNSKKYNLNGDNWGNVKGLSFKDVCVVLNPTTYKKYPDSLYELAPTTLSKFYVACTRTKRNLFFIEQKKIPSKYVE